MMRRWAKLTHYKPETLDTRAYNWGRNRFLRSNNYGRYGGKNPDH